MFYGYQARLVRVTGTVGRFPPPKASNLPTPALPFSTETYSDQWFGYCIGSYRYSHECTFFKSRAVVLNMWGMTPLVVK